MARAVLTIEEKITRATDGKVSEATQNFIDWLSELVEDIDPISVALAQNLYQDYVKDPEVKAANEARKAENEAKVAERKSKTSAREEAIFNKMFAAKAAADPALADIAKKLGIVVTE